MTCILPELKKARTAKAGARTSATKLDAKRREEQRQARCTMIAILDAELAGWHAYLSAALETMCRRSPSVRAGSCLAIRQLSARVDRTARKKQPAMKRAAAFRQLQRGESP